MKPGLLLVLLLAAISGYSQNIDSLMTVARNSKNDSVSTTLLNAVSYYYIFNDSKKAFATLKEGKSKALRKKYHYGYIELLITEGVYYDVNGKRDSARIYFQKAHDLSKKGRYINLQTRATNNLGMVSWNIGDYNKALDYFFKALKLNERVAQAKKVPEATMYSNIGLIYQEMNLFNKALEYHKMAYEFRVKNNRYLEVPVSLNNLGICYKNLDMPDMAIDRYREGLAVAAQYKNTTEYYKILENYSNVLAVKKQYKEAIANYLKILNPPPQVAITNKTRISVYSELAYAYNNLKQPRTALLYAEKGLEILNKNPDLTHYSRELYLWLSHTYYMLGNTDKGQYYSMLSSQVTKDVFSAANAKEIAALEIKFETEKKEKLIAENQAKLIKTEAEARQKNYMFMIALFFIIFLSVIGYLLFRQQRLKSRQMQKEFELKSALSQIENQNKLQEQRLSISRDLHDNIGAQLTFIISTLDNLKFRLPENIPAVGSKLDGISNFTRQTIIELRDTIWAMNTNHITFEDLRVRILNFIERAQEADENIDFKFKIDSALTTMELSSITGMNVYRTIQEAINNTIKHSKATSMEIIVFEDNGMISIIIRDNGNGFERDTIVTGNGLLNMEKRIEDIGGSFTLTTAINEGAMITIHLPQKAASA